MMMMTTGSVRPFAAARPHRCATFWPSCASLIAARSSTSADRSGSRLAYRIRMLDSANRLIELRVNAKNPEDHIRAETLMRILIVEDEQRIATDIAEAVSGGGYVPEIVGDGEDAWFQGGTEAYAAIILDLGLPRLDG